MRTGTFSRAVKRGCVAALSATLLLTGLIPALSVTQSARAASSFTTAAAAPADSVGYLNFPLAEDNPQWAAAKTVLDRTPLGPMIDEAIAEQLNGLPLDAFLGGEVGLVATTQVAAALAEASSSVGLPGASSAATAGALTTPENFGVVIVLDARAPDTAFAGISAAISDQASGAGAAVETVEYNGVEITVAPSVEENQPDMVVAQVDDHVLIGFSATDLEPVIDAAQGDAASLADSESFSMITSNLPADFLMLGYTNTVALQDAQAASGQDPLAQFGISTADLTQPRVSGFTIAADDLGFRMETVAMNADGSAIPAGPDNFDSGLAAKTPGTALFFMSAMNLASAGASEEGGPGILEIALALAINGGMGMMNDGAAPAAAEPTTLDQWVAQQFEQVTMLIGFNPQTELLQQFTGEYGMWINVGADPSSMGGLFTSGVGDAAAVSNALSSVAQLIQGATGGSGGTVATRDVNGSTVNSINMGMGVPAIEFGVVDGAMVIGVGSAVDLFAGGASDSLADNGQFNEVMGALPVEHNGSLYVDFAQILPVLQALDTSSMGGSSDMAMIDADPTCANYATQEEAQAAYDAFEVGTEYLDSDFDGEVCEDFFNPVAEAPSEPVVEAGPAFADLDLSSIKAFGLVGYDQDGMRKSSSILVIGE